MTRALSYLVSTNPLEQSVTISAKNIIEGAGAMITTVLPPGGLPGYSNADKQSQSDARRSE